MSDPDDVYFSDRHRIVNSLKWLIVNIYWYCCRLTSLCVQDRDVYSITECCRARLFHLIVLNQKTYSLPVVGCTCFHPRTTAQAHARSGSSLNSRDVFYNILFVSRWFVCETCQSPSHHKETNHEMDLMLHYMHSFGYIDVLKEPHQVLHQAFPCFLWRPGDAGRARWSSADNRVGCGVCDCMTAIDWIVYNAHLVLVESLCWSLVVGRVASWDGAVPLYGFVSCGRWPVVGGWRFWCWLPVSVLFVVWVCSLLVFVSQPYALCKHHSILFWLCSLLFVPCVWCVSGLVIW